MISKAYAVWIGVGTLGFVASVIALDLMDAPTIIVFLSGMGFWAVTDPIMYRLMEWEGSDE